MKKIIVLFATILIISGCSKKQEEIYLGEFLEVGVVGSSLLPELQNIQYKNVALSDVKGKKGEFDVLIINPEAFSEADQEKYIPLYDSIEYPILFFGMKDFKMFAFTTKGMTIEKSKDDNVAYVEGFQHINGSKEFIQIYKSENETHTDKEMLIMAFNYLFGEEERK